MRIHVKSEADSLQGHQYPLSTGERHLQCNLSSYKYNIIKLDLISLSLST